LTAPAWTKEDLVAGEAVQTVERVAAHLTPMGLDEVNAAARLLTRVDRKYVVTAAEFERFAEAIADDVAVLEIAGRRLFGCESTYLDTPRLDSYRAHLQGRRLRYKVRLRTYLDSGETLLEVKLKGRRGATVKHRAPHPPGRLTADGRRFVATTVGTAYGIATPDDLAPSLTTTCRRMTLVCVAEGARITCDVDVTCGDGDRVATLHDDRVLVETKAGPAGSSADRVLRSLGHRPVSVSKYCVGVALLHPQLASNPWHALIRQHFTAPGAVPRPGPPLYAVPSLRGRP
jgi:hypothetical protein